MKRSAYDAEYERVRRDAQPATREIADELPGENRLNAAELKAKYGADWGIKEPPRKAEKVVPAPSWDAVAAVYCADPARLAKLLS